MQQASLLLAVAYWLQRSMSHDLCNTSQLNMPFAASTDSVCCPPAINHIVFGLVPSCNLVAAATYPTGLSETHPGVVQIVNCAGLVSKWVGDTPKNIDALFQEARATDAVLCFDEAEGLFGTRSSDMGNSTDRYAAMDVGEYPSQH